MDFARWLYGIVRNHGTRCGAKTREEAEAEIEIEQLYCMYNIPRIGQIYVLFKAQLKDGLLVRGGKHREPII